jgi:hypothetical protein
MIRMLDEAARFIPGVQNTLCFANFADDANYVCSLHYFSTVDAWRKKPYKIVVL